VILDVDGTLVDSNDAHAHAFVEAFSAEGHPVGFSEVRRLIGKGADKLIPELIGRYEESLAERKKAIFRERYLPGLRPFPGVKDLLERLRQMGLRLVVASSAGKDELDALLAVAGAQDYLEARTDADDAERSKPDPDIVQAALRRLKLPAAACVMVGDTPYDAAACAAAGVAFIGLTCGGWPADRLQPALAVCSDPTTAIGLAR
jgi:HAD superfamily hydrolase (TIGR01509 family)